jgi:C4-dicarboxylate transporter, DctM subunit
MAIDLPILSILLLVSLVVILAFGVWIGVTLGLVGLMAMYVATSGVAIDQSMMTSIWAATANWQLAALPLFIWMGEICFEPSYLRKCSAAWHPGFNGCRVA